jgi:hypothetical protein
VKHGISLLLLLDNLVVGPRRPAVVFDLDLLGREQPVHRGFEQLATESLLRRELYCCFLFGAKFTRNPKRLARAARRIVAATVAAGKAFQALARRQGS